MKYPQKIAIPMGSGTGTKEAYWMLTEKSKISLPEYIEGIAKGTLWLHPTGMLYRWVEEDEK
jgi:hypothetical protein